MGENQFPGTDFRHFCKRLKYAKMIPVERLYNGADTDIMLIDRFWTYVADYFVYVQSEVLRPKYLVVKMEGNQ